MNKIIQAMHQQWNRTMDGKKNITIKEIANFVGVHPSTVSRALNPGSKTPPSEEVIKKIESAVLALGYHPNRMASGLRTKRSMLIGVMVTDLADTLFPRILRGIESVMEPLGYNSLVVNTDDDPHRAAQFLDVFRERGVDGVLNASVLSVDPATTERFQEGLPIVTFNRRLKDGSVPSVINDEAEGLRSVIKHLYSLGHRRIAVICGPQNRSTGSNRFDACLNSLKALNIEPPDDAIVFARSFEESEGGRGLATILSTNFDPTAIVCCSDRLAIGAIRELRVRDIKCPEQISVTGFNDVLNVDLIEPSLTTVRVHKHELGAIAARTLLDLLEMPDQVRLPQAIVPVELIVRGSSGPVNSD